MLRFQFILFALSFSCHFFQTVTLAESYYGKLVGDFRTHAHGVRGTVYIVNENTFFIKNFEYDGQGPNAYFWGDVSEEPTSQGFIITNEMGTKDVLGHYFGRDLILTLTDGRLIKDMKSLSVWCREFSVNFGSIRLSPGDVPMEKSLGPLPSLAHAVSSEDVIIKDSKTLLITKLRYDGAGPDAFFLVGKGIKPHSEGIKVPDENGRLEKLRGYEGKNVMLHLPGDLTVFDIEWIGLYCIRFEQNFGHVMIPARPNVPANLDDLRSMIMNPSSTATTLSRSATSALKQTRDGKYYGKFLANFKTNAHEVQGSVYAASEDTFFIEGFHYDGQGPDAYFWAGTTDRPSPNGFIVPDEFGTRQVLGKYNNQSFAVTLPDGKKISEVKWLSVWCRKFAVNFGHVFIPEGFEPPMEADLGPVSSLAHGVRSGKVVVKDAKTIIIRDLHYDGAGPDAFFYVGTGTKPHVGGTKVQDERGSLSKLRGYTGQDVMLRLPDPLTVFDIDWLSLFCISFEQDFGHVKMPDSLNVPADMQTIKAMEMKFDNCEEMFPGILHVSWKIMGQDLFLQLAGQAGHNEYISFGRSGNDDRAAMIGADVVVAFYDDDDKKPKVIDYYLSAKSQCSQGSGACPDIKLRGSENSELLSWEHNEGLLKVTLKRPLAASDGQDLSIPVSIPVSVVAAIGPLNSQKEVAFHSHHYSKESKMVHFGRSPPQDRCGPLMPPVTTKTVSWGPRRIDHVTTFRAQIGPTGGSKGYDAITGFKSWGVAWWINGQLIPELIVRRGTKYSFVVEGGSDPSNPASHHPFYITNNEEGGGGQFMDQLDTPKHRIFAGVMMGNNQAYVPVGVGRLCEWKHKTVDQSETSKSFEDFKSTLRLVCDEGQPGTFDWTPDENTPDLVYYQCFTHRNLGWKIRVLDAGAEAVGSMEHHLGDEPPRSSSSITVLHPFLLLFTAVVGLTF